MTLHGPSCSVMRWHTCSPAASMLHAAFATHGWPTVRVAARAFSTAVRPRPQIVRGSFFQASQPFRAVCFLRLPVRLNYSCPCQDTIAKVFLRHLRCHGRRQSRPWAPKLLGVQRLCWVACKTFGARLVVGLLCWVEHPRIDYQCDPSLPVRPDLIQQHGELVQKTQLPALVGLPDQHATEWCTARSAMRTPVRVLRRALYRINSHLRFAFKDIKQGFLKWNRTFKIHQPHGQAPRVSGLRGHLLNSWQPRALFVSPWQTGRKQT